MAEVRDYEDIKMCNCAKCEMELLGESEAEWWRSLPSKKLADYPKPVAGRIKDRPYCQSCYRSAAMISSALSSFQGQA